MDLIENYGVHTAPSEPRSIESFWAELTRNGKPSAEAVTWPLVEYALTLADQDRLDLAEVCVIEMSRQFDMTMEHYFEICMQLSQKNAAFKSSRLFSYYIKNGGARREAYEFEIMRLYQKKDHDGVINLFKKSQKWFSWKDIAPHILFLVSNAFMSTSRIDECFPVISYLVDQNPDDQAFRNNIIYLALHLNYQPARNYFFASIDAISKSFKGKPLENSTDEIPFVIDLNNSQDTEIISALHQHGFCHIKNGVDSNVAKEILEHIKKNDARLQFPVGLDPYVTERCAVLLRFDALSIVNAVLPTPASLDQRRSVVRKVDPGAAHSFTPFHQDATAFHKAIVNIWTPLTPAGGDYPTIELVKRRLSFAEATMETSDGYNLVKIDDAEILRKYQGDLYEPTDVAPGECIIFLGTTIHRSTNLKAATKPRYNLEIRWA